jgi:hypothetical protein
VLATGAAALTGCGGHARCTGGSGAPKVALDASRRAAARLADAAPSAAKYVRTTRERAAELVGGAVNAPDVQVYLVILTGHFGGKGVKPGRYADFTVDRRSGKLLDIGTSNLLPALSPLGRVRPFRPSRC